jgi:hypothetical protein
VVERRGGGKKEVFAKEGAYILHLDKSKKKTEIEGEGEVIEELCDNIYSFQSKANFTARRNKSKNYWGG